MCYVSSGISNRGSQRFGEFTDVRSYVGNNNNKLSSFEHVWLICIPDANHAVTRPVGVLKHGQSQTAMSKTQSAAGYRTAVLGWLYCNLLFTVIHPSDVTYSQLQQKV